MKDHWWAAYTGKEFGGYWFLPALFYCMVAGLVAGLLLNKYNIKKHLWPDIIAHIALFAIVYVIYISGIAVKVPYCLHFVKMYPFFAMGVIFSRHNAFGKIVRENNTIFTVCLLFYIILWWCQPRGSLNLSGFPAIVILIQLFIKYDSHIPKIFTLLGRYSLEIYLFHYFFLPPLTGMGMYLSQQEGTAISSVPFTVEMFTSILIALPIIALSLLATIIVRNSKFLRMIVLGEKDI